METDTVFSILAH